MAVRKRTSMEPKAGGHSRLMDLQDTKARGDSRATRTRRVTFSTTDEVADAVEDAAYERHMPRSRLIEDALVQYLGL